jgi:hypothetical protein
MAAAGSLGMDNGIGRHYASRAHGIAGVLHDEPDPLGRARQIRRGRPVLPSALAPSHAGGVRLAPLPMTEAVRGSRGIR